MCIGADSSSVNSTQMAVDQERNIDAVATENVPLVAWEPKSLMGESVVGRSEWIHDNDIKQHKNAVTCLTRSNVDQTNLFHTDYDLYYAMELSRKEYLLSKATEQTWTYTEYMQSVVRPDPPDTGMERWSIHGSDASSERSAASTEKTPVTSNRSAMDRFGGGAMLADHHSKSLFQNDEAIDGQRNHAVATAPWNYQMQSILPSVKNQHEASKSGTSKDAQDSHASRTSSVHEASKHRQIDPVWLTRDTIVSRDKTFPDRMDDDRAAVSASTHAAYYRSEKIAAAMTMTLQKQQQQQQKQQQRDASAPSSTLTPDVRFADYKGQYKPQAVHRPGTDMQLSSKNEGNSTRSTSSLRQRDAMHSSTNTGHDLKRPPSLWDDQTRSDVSDGTASIPEESVQEKPQRPIKQLIKTESMLSLFRKLASSSRKLIGDSSSDSNFSTTKKFSKSKSVLSLPADTKEKEPPTLSRTDILLSLARKYPDERDRERLAQFLASQQRALLTGKLNEEEGESLRPSPPAQSSSWDNSGVGEDDNWMTTTTTNKSRTSSSSNSKKSSKSQSVLCLPADTKEKEPSTLSRTDILLSLARKYPDERDRQRLAQFLASQQRALLTAHFNDEKEESPQPPPSSSSSWDSNSGRGEKDSLTTTTASNSRSTLYHNNKKSSLQKEGKREPAEEHKEPRNVVTPPEVQVMLAIQELFPEEHHRQRIVQWLMSEMTAWKNVSPEYNHTNSNSNNNNRNITTTNRNITTNNNNNDYFDDDDDYDLVYDDVVPIVHHNNTLPDMAFSGEEKYPLKASSAVSASQQQQPLKQEHNGYVVSRLDGDYREDQQEHYYQQQKPAPVVNPPPSSSTSLTSRTTTTMTTTTMTTTTHMTEQVALLLTHPPQPSNPHHDRRSRSTSRLRGPEAEADDDLFQPLAPRRGLLI